MYKRILVPLDGSETAECILRHVREAAKRYEVEEVVLLRVVETVPVWAMEWADPAASERAEQEAARQYLSQVGSELRRSYCPGHSWPPGYKPVGHRQCGRPSIALLQDSNAYGNTARV